MNARSHSKFAALFLAASLVAATPVKSYAQDGAKQDMKSAGHDTKDATEDAGHGIKTGTEKGYHKTKSGTKKAYHKTKHGVKKAGHNIKKTLDPHANSSDANHQ